jgi:hypothetical protein
MGRFDSFLDGGSGSHTPISIKPLTPNVVSDEEDTLEWIKETADLLGDYYTSYRSLYKENVAAYVGEQGGGSEGADAVRNNDSLNRIPKPGRKDLNVIQPIVEAHLARITSSRANVSVLPVHSNEFHDLSAAKTSELMIDQSFTSQNVNGKFELAGRSMLICGHSYMLMEWDNEIGPPVSQIKEPILMLDEDGQPTQDEDGNDIVVHPNTRMGDLSYRSLRPDQVLEQPGKPWDKKNWIITLELKDVYETQLEYPSATDEIKGGSHSPTDTNSWLHKQSHELEHQVLVMTCYHRATRAFPNGWKIVCTPEVLLESTELEFPTLNSYGLLPIARLDDTLVPGYELPLPMSVMEAGKGYAETFNRVDKVLRKDLSLSVPKWITHKLSGVNYQQLNTASSVVSFKGNVAPQLVRPSSTSGDFFAYRNGLLAEMKQNTGASHMFNAPPSNTRATSMLEHQEEQEFTRAEPLIRHMNDFMANVAKIGLAIMADRYSEDEERVLKLMGTTGPSAYIRLQTADLMGPYDIKFERTSSLPHSKQGRISAALSMFESGIIDANQFKKSIGYSSDPDFMTSENKAFEKQLLENDLMGRGQQIESPLEHEDHVEHLKALYPVIDSIEFAEMPDEIKGQFVSHCMAHEMFAWRRAQISIKYAIKVADQVQWKFFSSLPAAIPISVDNPGAVTGEQVLQERAVTPGLTKAVTPGPDNPSAV